MLMGLVVMVIVKGTIRWVGIIVIYRVGVEMSLSAKGYSISNNVIGRSLCCMLIEAPSKDRRIIRIGQRSV